MTATFAVAPVAARLVIAPLRCQTDATVTERSVLPTSADEAMPLVQRGDRAAFAVVYDELVDRVFGVVLRVLRDRAMAEEVTQEIFVEVWRLAPRWDANRGGVAAWTLTIARRRAVDRVRREQSRRDRADVYAREESAVAAPGSEPVGEGVVASAEASRVRTALAELPPDQREVLTLAFLDGRPHAEIATALGLPLGTVKGRIRGGLKKLRSRLDDG